MAIDVCFRSSTCNKFIYCSDLHVPLQLLADSHQCCTSHNKTDTCKFCSQVNQQGSQQYSMAQRWASIIINGILLFLIGFVSSMFGVGVINVLVAVRSFFDSHIEGIEMSQEVLGISVAHGVYMATSGNIRYQVLAGIVEERGVNIMFAHNVRLLRITSSIIRTINTYYGSEHWIVFIRYFGLQDA